MASSADVVVIGGGAMGASSAYHLANAGAGRVVLLEREAALGLGSTGLCAGGFRYQFSSEINVRLSQASVPMIRSFTADHGLPLDVHPDGYLFVARSPAKWSAYRDAAEFQAGLGAPVELLDAAACADLIPGLETGDILGATFGPQDGLADPSGLTNGYATLARRAGATVRTGVTASAIRVARGRVAGVETSDGPIDAPVVILAAGVWSVALAATAGIALPVEPLPRHIVVTSAFEGRPERRTMVIDGETAFYFHREGEGVLMGMPVAGEHPTWDAAVDDRFIAEELLPKALEFYPPIEAAGLQTAWTGFYEMTPDRHAILGPVAALPGLQLAVGFSGHGFQHAPIVGKLLAEAVVDGAPRTVDISTLAFERFERGELIHESHVV